MTAPHSPAYAAEHDVRPLVTVSELASAVARSVNDWAADDGAYDIAHSVAALLADSGYPVINDDPAVTGRPHTPTSPHHTTAEMQNSAFLQSGETATVAVCGSTRFMAEMLEAAREETVAGRIVTLPLCDLKVWDPLWPSESTVERLKGDLDRLHRVKIERADLVLIVAPDGYLGESTRAELAYARYLGKPVRFWRARAVAA